MKLFKHMNDGGPNSVVEGYWLIEWKRVFSIVLLKFNPGSREEFHSHAFNCFSWVLRGKLVECFHKSDQNAVVHKPSLKPFMTYRDTFHKVYSDGVSWVLSFRGPWSDTWKEYNPSTGEEYTLKSGRKRVAPESFKIGW